MSVSLLRGRTVRRALGVLVVAGFLGAGATGYSNDAGAKTENTIDASPTPTNTPTDGDGDSDGAEEPAQDTPAEPEQHPTPVEPEAMKTGDKAGAIAAAQYFVEAIEYSLHSNNPELLEKYSYEACSGCDHVFKVIENRANKSSESVETDYKITKIADAEFVGKNYLTWKIPVSLKITEQLKGVDGTHTEIATLGIYVTYESTGWEITELEPEAS